MRDVGVLTFLPDLFDLDRATFVYKETLKTPARPIGASELGDITRPTVVVDAAKLVAELRRGHHAAPAWLLDFADALKLLNGVSKNDGGARRNDPWRHIVAHARARFAPPIAPGVQALFEASVAWPTDLGDLAIQLAHFSDEVASAWSEICDALEAAGEAERYQRVEAPVSKVFYERQASGIAIDQVRLTQLLEIAERDKYVAYNELAETINVSPSGLTVRTVGTVLPRTDAAHLAPFTEAPNFEEYIRLASSESTFARTFYRFIRAGRDLRILSSLQGGGVVRTYPEFQIMGTVTSRILVSNPGLQHLRKDFRSVVAADRAKRLAYLDFAQFEPGILAHLSGDADFIAAYNQADVYEQLAVAIFGHADRRPAAKRMFLSFCYGMSVNRIVDLVGGDDLEGRARSFSNFVDRFPGMVAFREDAEQRLLQGGSVHTMLGNHRYRTQSDGQLSPAERRWPVSQVIQGTASLVFKEAVVALAERFGNDAVLLPVHDAVLMQFDRKGYRAAVAEAGQIMQEALFNRCPTVRGRVVVSETF